jgi:hypothetical protein
MSSEKQRRAVQKTGLENIKLKRGIFHPGQDHKIAGALGGNASKASGKGLFGPHARDIDVYGCHVRWHVNRQYVSSLCDFCNGTITPEEIGLTSDPEVR